MFKPKSRHVLFRITGLVLIGLSLNASIAAEPLSEPVRTAESRGIDFSRPVTVKFEWKPAATPQSEEAIRQALQSQGFAWARAEAREAQQSAPKITISATRSGQLSPGVLSATIKSVSSLATGQGTQSWSIVQQQ